MTQPTASAQPPKETPATIRDLIAVKIALADLLAEEALCMDRMQIARVGELQERKLKLTGLLERYMRYMHLHPESISTVTAEEKSELRTVADRFHLTMKKNYATLLVARAVNGAIVKCVTQTVAKKDVNPIYDAHGRAANAYRAPISLTLNQTI